MRRCAIAPWGLRIAGRSADHDRPAAALARNRGGDAEAATEGLRRRDQGARAYERLFLMVNPGRHLTAERVKALDELRDRGVIRIRDVPASIRRIWPGGRFDELTLAEIYELCGKKRGGG